MKKNKDTTMEQRLAEQSRLNTATPLSNAPAAPRPEVLMAMRSMQGIQPQSAPQADIRPDPQPINGTAATPDPVRAQHQPMTEMRIKEAMQVMQKYRDAKQSVEARIIAAQQWWKMRNWEQIEAERGTKGTQKKKSNTAWLWNCIVGKHAEAMDAFPEPLFLAREQADEMEAKHLSEIVPVILAQNGFEETYSQCAWQKETEGTALYGVFWDGKAMNGMGDIKVRKINVLNFYAEPGIEDIQDSANVFNVKKVSIQRLEQQYPQLQGKLGTTATRVSEYQHDDNVDDSNKALVVDWYYKKWVNGTKVLHYCQFVNEHILYASENDPECAQRGYYDDGEYPFVNDVLFPVADSIYGIGYIDVGKDTQADIDTLSQAMVTNALVSSTPRYFSRQDGGINEDEFMDLSHAIVHVNGNLGADSVSPVQTPQLPGNAVEIYHGKIEELKFITGNTDVQNGAVPSGVTSGIAIQALKEDAGRSSKDASRTSYRAMKRLYTMVIERIRQFYTMQRQFRIVGEDGTMRYLAYSSRGLQMQEQMGIDGKPAYRLPVIDVDVHVQRENAYTRMALNDLATQFYQMGIFNPAMAPQALMMLSMMEFKGKETIVQKVQMGAGMLGMLQQQAMLGGPRQPAGPVKATEEDATESGKANEDPASSPAIERMRASLDEAIRP